MKYSFIIPVFNRPNEVDELLESLTTQTFKDFDVVVVEDGSTLPATMWLNATPNDLPYIIITSQTLGLDKRVIMVLNAPRATMCSFSTLT